MKKQTTIIALCVLFSGTAFTATAHSPLPNGNKSIVAFYQEGELLGSRQIDISQIPKSIAKTLEKKYKDYQIGSSATEIKYEGQTYYYVSATGKSKVLTLRCLPNGEILIEKQEKIKSS